MATFIALATLYGLLVPPWEAPDEVAHLAYVKHLVRERALPVQGLDRFAEEHQAPLYYALAALAVSPVDLQDSTGAFRPNRRFGWEEGDDRNMAVHGENESFLFRGQVLALHLIRLLSTLLSAGTVACAVTLARLVLPSLAASWVLAGAFVAFNPQFVFVSGAASNDNLLALCSTGFFVEIARARLRPERLRTWFAVGAWLGLALLAKSSAVTLFVIGLATVTLVARERRSLDFSFRAGLAMFSVATLLAGWWFARNLWLYGDPFGLGPFLGSRLAVPKFKWGDLPYVLLMQFRSYWGYFGWMSIPAPPWFHVLAGGLVLLGSAGLLRIAARRGPLPLSRAQTELLALLAAAVALQELFMLCAIATFGPSWHQGRYLFPVIAPAAVLLAAGTGALLPQRALPPIAVAIATGLCIATGWLLFAVILPAYARSVGE